MMFSPGCMAVDGSLQTARVKANCSLGPPLLIARRALPNLAALQKRQAAPTFPHSAGHFDMIELLPREGQPALALTEITSEETATLGDAFAAIDPWARYPYPANALQSYFATLEPGAPRYAIRNGGALAGAVGIRFNWLSGPYVQFLGLLPGHQSQGTGGRVLRWLEDDARKHGARNLWVAAADFNADAIRFYERFGFISVAQLDDLVRNGRTERLLRKKL
jgi:diamine N-acetyltransferase